MTKVQRIKLVNNDKRAILRILINYVRETQKWDELEEEIDQINKDFVPYIKKQYDELLNLTPELKSFSVNYFMYSNKNFNTTKAFPFFPKKEFNDRELKDFGIYDLFCSYCNWKSCSCELPFYNDISYKRFYTIPGHENDEGCYYVSDYLNKLYTDYLADFRQKCEDKKKETIEILSKMMATLNACKYADEVKEVLPIKEVKDFVDNLPKKKLSTELCTMNKENIDFIKNYVESQK